MIDGFFIYHLVNELNHELKRARLEKMMQQDASSFVLSFYHQGKKKQLIIDLSPENFRMHLSKIEIENTVTSQFVITLKKQLEGAILESIEQYQTDRVIIMHFTFYDFIDGPIPKMLIFEAMGKHSNLLLVKDGIIVDTFKKMFFETGRQLLPQAEFSFFPSEKTSALSINYESISSPKDLVDRYLGISTFLAKYLYDHQLQWQDIPFKPTQNVTTHRFYAADLFDQGDAKLYFPSLSELLCHFRKEHAKPFVSERQFIEKQLKKLKLKKEQLSMSLEDAYEQLKTKDQGDLIYSSGLSMDIYLSELKVGDQLLMLDPTKTLNENAQYYYKLYQKAKRAIHHLQEQLKQNEATIVHLNDLNTYISISTPESIKDIDQELHIYGYKKVKPQVHKKKKSSPQILSLYDGAITYLIGRNNYQNEYITHQLAQKNDMWFHVKDAPGAHVVVNTSILNEAILRKAAMLAAYFSSMRQSSSIPVDYTLIKHLKKIPGVPGYKVVYKNQQTIYIDIDEQKIANYLKNV